MGLQALNQYSTTRTLLSSHTSNTEIGTGIQLSGHTHIKLTSAKARWCFNWSATEAREEEYIIPNRARGIVFKHYMYLFYVVALSTAVDMYTAKLYKFVHKYAL